MKIAEVMTRDVRVIHPDRSVRDAARLMDEMNVGVLPVCDGERLVGMITDRDIAVRSTATGVAPDRHRVAEIMSGSVQWCREEDDAGEVLRHMSKKQIRRMPVIDNERRLIGIVALGDLATDNAPGADEALRRISSPSEPDRSGRPTTARADQTRRDDRDPLTEDEHRELDRRRQDRGEGGADRFGGGASDVGPPRGDLQGFSSDYRSHGSRGLRDEEVSRSRIGSGEGWRGDWDRRDRGFRFREEDDRRAAFAGSFNEGYGEAPGEGPGIMPGGFGGDGYSNYGENYGRGAQGGGAGGSAYHGDFGSRRDGTPRHYGSEGEENYDRGILSGRERRPSSGGTRFSNETAAYGREAGEAGGHRGRGPRGYARANERIHDEICERLTHDPHLDASDIDVGVGNGEVTLSGTVRARADKRRAEDLAEEVAGVRHIQNNLRLASAGGATGTGEESASAGAGASNPGTSGGTAGTAVGSPSSDRKTGGSR